MPEISTRPLEVPIKKKASVPIRTRQGGVPIKTPERAATKATDPTTAQAFREAKKPPWPPPRKMPMPLLPQAARP